MSKIDVYGSFAQALFFSGPVAVPKYLLLHYAALGLTDQQMVLLIHILSEMGTNPYPQASVLAQRMQAGTEEIEEMIGRLVERGLLAIEKSWNAEERKWSYSYSILGLIDKLAEQWALEGVKQFTSNRSPKAPSVPATEAVAPVNDPTADKLISLFEQELGRELTVFECQHIEAWLSAHYSGELIVEALRRGVAAGIRSFRYLDSILREWEKKGLHTKAEVEADDRYFQARQEKKAPGRKRAKKVQDGKTDKDKYEDFYL
ncbi:Replication protein, DnaD/DnaB domain [Acididesulfobacillus acetoxydans]|uniref:DnaD-like protein n=1 Tax=Acididesulfobacillus acetoxydans TaxID=1561005 RepID=A0A8S0WPD7_9FIRM|nr:DnaD domain protein [Acididesulfobacillus acetoxydans]CAA7601854.1 Replication protein, DnaD/DnaB domain [Acididesulfobacillus acetoxydans]CEJ08671.1 DnaD-like protein [Acididesulfobacillus acetoxydans]